MDGTNNTPTGAHKAGSLDATLLLLQRVVRTAVASIVVTDPRLAGNPIIYHNPAFERVCGYTEGEIDGHNMRLLQGPDTDPAAVATIRAAIAGEYPCRVVLLNYRKDGTTFWNELEMSPMRDESGVVTNFVGVQNDVTRRVEIELERDALLEQQRHVSETLQRALLLTPPPATLNGLEVSTQYLPAWDEALIGGDFFDTLSLSENRVALVVGDCTGKGLKAAQYTAEVKYALRALLREHKCPSLVLCRLNRYLIDSQRLDGRAADAFVCVAVAVVDTLTGTAYVASSGMEPPLIVRRSGATEPTQVRGLILGLDPAAKYEHETVTLGSGDTLVMITDGITEAHSPRPDRDMFGYDRFQNVAAAAAADALTVEAMGERIVATARAFTQDKLEDDVCVLLARRG